MLISIKYFGLIDNNLLVESELQENSNVNALLKKLIEAEPANEELLNKATILVNKKKADPNTILKDKDEVMILTILGGG